METLLPEHVEFVRTYKRTARLGLPEEAFEPSPGTTSYADYVGQLYRRFARMKGTAMAGEKTPDYVKRIPLLDRLFPRAKFVHIIRDGREVVQSVLEWSTDRKGPAKLEIWRENPFAVASLWWSQQVSAGRDAGRQLGSRYMEVRYYGLSADPEPEMKRVADFLGLPFSDAMVRFSRGVEQSTIRSSRQRAPGVRPYLACETPTP